MNGWPRSPSRWSGLVPVWRQSLQHHPRQSVPVGSEPVSEVPVDLNGYGDFEVGVVRDNRIVPGKPTAMAVGPPERRFDPRNTPRP